MDYVRSRLNKTQFEVLFRAVISTVALVAVLAMVVLTALGKIAPWTGRFYSLLDPSYAKNNIPIIASVSEHQPTAWSSFYFDLQMLTFMFPVGLYFCFSKLTDENIFIILYGVLSIYFAVSSETSKTNFMYKMILTNITLYNSDSTNDLSDETFDPHS